MEKRLIQEEIISARKVEDMMAKESAKIRNKKRSLVDKITHREKISPMDIMHEEAAKENKERDRIQAQMLSELNKIKDPIERMAEEAKIIIPKIEEGADVIPLRTSSGYLRLGKDEKGIYITGIESDDLAEKARNVIERLKEDFPDTDFRIVQLKF